MPAGRDRRRILLAGGALALLPCAALAQPRGRRRIALPFSGVSGPMSAQIIEALKRGMREQGFPEESVEYDVRYAQGSIPMQEKIVAELIERHPDVIVVAGPPFVRAARKITQTIPVVMANVSDPVGNKFIDSLARPGGNVTGVATQYETVLPKIAEVLQELVPSASRIAVLMNANNPSTAAFWTSVEPALRTLGKTPVRVDASTEPQIVDAFRRMRGNGIQATIVVADNQFVTFRDRVASLAQAERIPTAYALREHVVAGGLVSYGPSLLGNYRASARYVAQILKGARPADLPVEQSSRFELVINRRAADSLGIRIPATILLRADEVIE